MNFAGHGAVPHATHEVTNQVPPLAGHDVSADPALLDAITRELGRDTAAASQALAQLHDLGIQAGSAQAAEHARLANEHPPALRTHNATGHRIDEVEFHPSWHALMGTAIGHGLHAAPWADPSPGAHLTRAAKFYVWSQAEAGHGCPVSMTYAVVPALRHAPALAAQFEPLLTAPVYDPGLRPPQGKSGLLAGMAMTEKQGGSDVRAGTTRAQPAPSLGDGAHLLTGHKWFCSAPMCDMFLVLAQAPDGLTCFLLPRVLPDGTRNGMLLQRLKDKLGNRSNASAEVEFDSALAWQVGEAGRGVRTIIDMVTATRLDCVLGSAAGMRRGTVTAVHHATYRQAFGKDLISQPLMANVLADLAIEAEAATALAIRLAGAAGRAAAGDAREAALLRVALPAAKHWVCKRFPVHAAEALECLGGNGYVEESGMPRLYREAPLNSIWEGSGNVTALDLLRALSAGRGTDPADALLAELELAAGGNRRLDGAVAGVASMLGEVRTAAGSDAAYAARRLAGAITVAVQAALLVRYAPDVVADAFCASRLAAHPGTPGGPGVPFGMLPDGVGLGPILDRARPAHR
ncbi:MAG TPA: acyl-CoA dehydrogenase family protein [Streptosporangiaceae bacterium]|nr:acyl-CoA dehydrogenase family protein [Streptosporangiaceae bacterium]